LDVAYKTNRFILIDSCLKSKPKGRVFDNLPEVVSECCKHIHILIQAAVYRNKQLALKIISINGLFLSLVAQLIVGWKPPIDNILLLSCSDDRKYQRKDQHVFEVKDILIKAISPEDIKEILEQMHFLHCQDDSTAQNIMDLLILLCTSGNARNHFQNTMINTIFKADLRHLIDCGSNNPAEIRLALNDEDAPNDFCMLFHTCCQDGKWKVRFKSPYAFESSEEKDMESTNRKLKYQAK
jgi:hypothetical protein